MDGINDTKPVSALEVLFHCMLVIVFGFFHAWTVLDLLYSSQIQMFPQGLLKVMTSFHSLQRDVAKTLLAFSTHTPCHKSGGAESLRHVCGQLKIKPVQWSSLLKLWTTEAPDSSSSTRFHKPCDLIERQLPSVTQLQDSQRLCWNVTNLLNADGWFYYSVCDNLCKDRFVSQCWKLHLIFTAKDNCFAIVIISGNINLQDLFCMLQKPQAAVNFIIPGIFLKHDIYSVESSSLLMKKIYLEYEWTKMLDDNFNFKVYYP